MTRHTATTVINTYARTIYSLESLVKSLVEQGVCREEAYRTAAGLSIFRDCRPFLSSIQGHISHCAVCMAKASRTISKIPYWKNRQKFIPGFEEYLKASQYSVIHPGRELSRRYSHITHPRQLKDLPPLHRAIEAGNMEKAARLITGGYDVNERDRRDWTPLHRAIGCRLDIIAELLITHGADVNARSAGGSTPLHWAAQKNNCAITRLLLARGALVEARDNLGYTPVEYAEEKWSRARRKDSNCDKPEVIDILKAHGALEWWERIPEEE